MGEERGATATALSCPCPCRLITNTHLHDQLHVCGPQKRTPTPKQTDHHYCITIGHLKALLAVRIAERTDDTDEEVQQLRQGLGALGCVHSYLSLSIRRPTPALSPMSTMLVHATVDLTRLILYDHHQCDEEADHTHQFNTTHTHISTTKYKASTNPRSPSGRRWGR